MRVSHVGTRQGLHKRSRTVRWSFYRQSCYHRLLIVLCWPAVIYCSVI